MCLKLTKPPNYCKNMLYLVPTLNSIYNQANYEGERERGAVPM